MSLQPEPTTPPSGYSSWRRKLWEIIFEAETPAGKAFDVVLLVCIVVSILAVVLESVAGIRQRFGFALRVAEWTFTVLFTLEYILRLVVSQRPGRYAFSFLGIVDLLAIVPTYLSLVVTGSQALLAVRALRLLRVFRILKIYRYLHEVQALVVALRRSRVKVVVFLFAVSSIILIMGSLMYVIEGAQGGFTSIPRSMYWAVVTVTTVGYGDIAPTTVLGQAVAAVAMILGYSLIIVPTGIFSYELTQAVAGIAGARTCPGCAAARHDSDALHCKYCGTPLRSALRDRS